MRIAGLLAAAVAGVALAFLLSRALGIVVLSWAALAVFTAAIWAARLPPKQERVIVWSLGAIVIILLAARVPLPWAAALGAVPGVAWLWAIGTMVGRP
ncbi:MAG TPA: hypothetical protein VH475_19770 [Tepidisphaeraceae bacterium]|jgi:hypothetical protein